MITDSIRYVDQVFGPLSERDFEDSRREGNTVKGKTDQNGLTPKDSFPSKGGTIVLKPLPESPQQDSGGSQGDDGSSAGQPPDPLPALALSNHPHGKGPLGNQLAKHSSKMFYSGSDRVKLVKTVQTMLTALGFDIGPTGVDGKFGDHTERAVKRFQESNLDFEGNPLKDDGLVGPETSDALNRKLVGIFYDQIVTPVKLTKDFKLVTVTEKIAQESGVKY